MSFLNQLTPDQRQMIIRLPYRIGLWVSHSDRTGGKEATERELQSLSNIIYGFAQEIFSSEDVQNIMAETIAQKDSWLEWTENLSSVPDDCRTVMGYVYEYADKKDLAALRNHLLEIAEAVAMSFCEHEFSTWNRFRTYISYIFHRKFSAGRRKSFQEYLSISPAERKALKSVAASLGTVYW